MSKVTAHLLKSIALEEIEGVLGNPYEYGGGDDTSDYMRVMTLGQIFGIISLTKELLKEVEE